MAEKGYGGDRPQKKAIPQDAEEYVKMAKEKASPTGKIMERVKAAKLNQLDDTVTDMEIIRARKALQDLQQSMSPTNQRQTENIASQLFKDRTPEQIQEILRGMTPQMIQNLKMVAEAVDNSPLSVLRQQQPAPSSGTRDDITALLLRYILDQKSQPQGGLTLEGVAALITAINTGKAPPQTGTSPMDTLKLMMEVNRPLYDQLAKKDKEVVDARLREMEAKMPGDLSEQIKYVKEMAPMLGIGSGQTNELDLRLEEMRQNREVDMKRLDWEQEKYKMESEADVAKYEQIGKILQGPIGDAIKNMGSAGADRVRGAGVRNAPISAGRAPKPVQTQCPNCGKAIFVDAEAETAVCGQCGAILQKQAVAPPQPQAPTHVADEKTAPRSDATESPEEEEGEVEDGHNEEGNTEDSEPEPEEQQ